jgi:hypothetical protein
MDSNNENSRSQKVKYLAIPGEILTGASLMIRFLRKIITEEVINET